MKGNGNSYLLPRKSENSLQAKSHWGKTKALLTREKSGPGKTVPQSHCDKLRDIHAHRLRKTVLVEKKIICSAMLDQGKKVSVARGR